MYGGRVIDNFDRRIVSTYMDEYMGDFLFDTFQPFHFYKDDNVNYHIPEDSNKDEYISKYFVVSLLTSSIPFIFENVHALHPDLQISLMNCHLLIVQMSLDCMLMLK